jgi:hypothetical protein
MIVAAEGANRPANSDFQSALRTTLSKTLTAAK